MSLRHFTLTEIALSQAIIYLALWMWNDHIATLFSLSFGIIALALLVISLLSEVFERSKVPRSYYWIMVVSFVVPFLIGAFFMILKNGDLDWMKF